MNKTIENQLKHRTIRKFKNIAIKEEILDEISKVCKQDYVNDVPELLIFIVDVFRNAKISEEMLQELDSKADMDRFFQGYTDGCLAAQNMYTAIESLNMGAVYFGSILNDTSKMVEILKLPKLTFPIVGLGFGYPDQEPALKPRMDISMKIFNNKYCIKDNYLESIKKYDEEMKTYYDLRNADKPLDSFSKQVVGILQNPNENRSKMLNVIRSQGFQFQLD